MTAPRKPDRNRHIKMVCRQCGYIARATRSWITQAGPVHCPIHGPMEIDTSVVMGEARKAISAPRAIRHEIEAVGPIQLPAADPVVEDARPKIDISQIGTSPTSGEFFQLGLRLLQETEHKGGVK